MNPRYTSQRCSHCGYIAAENRDKEKFSCISCGHSEHADINAACNILRAGLAQGGSEAFLVNAEPVSRYLAFAQVIARRALMRDQLFGHTRFQPHKPKIESESAEPLGLSG